MCRYAGPHTTPGDPVCRTVCRETTSGLQPGRLHNIHRLHPLFSGTWTTFKAVQLLLHISRIETKTQLKSTDSRKMDVKSIDLKGRSIYLRQSFLSKWKVVDETSAHGKFNPVSIRISVFRYSVKPISSIENHSILH